MRVVRPAVLLALVALLVPAVPTAAVAEPEPEPESTIGTEPEPEPNAWEWSTEVPSPTVYARLPTTVAATLRDGPGNPVAGVAVCVSTSSRTTHGSRQPRSLSPMRAGR